jgi:hypothetical protein
MAHYDLYQSLDLSRSTPSDELITQIDAKLAATPDGDAGMRDQLTTARAILGDETRRSLYDHRLDDPAAPEIGVVSLRELAALNTGDASGTGGAGGTDGFPRQAGRVAHWVEGSFKQSDMLAIGITAVVTALVVGVSGWALGLFGGGAHSAPRAVVNDMLSQSSEDDLRSWALENTTHEDRDAVMSSLRLSDGQTFNGMDVLFGGRDLQASSEALGVEYLKMFAMQDTEDIYDGLEDEGYSREEVDSVVIIGVVDGDGENHGGITLIERDGDYLVTDVKTR